MPSYARPNLKSTRNGSGYTLTRLQEVKEVSDIDILFVGSSHAYRGFDPRIFKEIGLNAFNLGTSAQTPLQTKFLLDRYLDEINPKEIIFQVSPLNFFTDGIESSVDIISNDFVDLQSIQLMLKTKDVNTYNTLIYSVYEDVLGKKTMFKENLAQRGNTYISGGYVETSNTGYKGDQKNRTDFSFKKIQLKAFDDMIEMVKSKGIKYRLVYVPITTPLYTTISKQYDFDALMNTYGAYYNFNKTQSLDSTFFYDKDHLNKKGVAVFNKKLITDLNFH
jgi:hypothetical protein